MFSLRVNSRADVVIEWEWHFCLRTSHLDGCDREDRLGDSPRRTVRRTAPDAPDAVLIADAADLALGGRAFGSQQNRSAESRPRRSCETKPLFLAWAKRSFARGNR